MTPNVIDYLDALILQQWQHLKVITSPLTRAVISVHDRRIAGRAHAVADGKGGVVMDGFLVLAGCWVVAAGLSRLFTTTQTHVRITPPKPRAMPFFPLEDYEETTAEDVLRRAQLDAAVRLDAARRRV